MCKKLLENIGKNIRVSFFLAAVVWGYFYFLGCVKADQYQIFNVKKTITWAQSQNTLYRAHSHRTIDGILLSEDLWRDYVFSMRIINPRDCGFLYDYRDANNYHFVYFQKATGAILSGHLNAGKADNVRSITLGPLSAFNVTAKKQDAAMKFFINDQLVFEKKTSDRSGKIGLMVNEVQAPPVVFHQIAIAGSLGNGKFVKAEVRVKPENGIVEAFRVILVFYLFFALFVVFYPWFAGPFYKKSFTIDEKTEKFFALWGPGVLHVFLAACFFWPFIARGEVAVFSYDNLGEIFPLFHYSQQNFLNILNGQSPWLWNPLIQNGFPFYSNHWDMIYYPLNWPVFLVSSENLLTALTLKSFLEVSALGIFAYGFFAIELNNRRWALFASVVYQMCSLLIFTMGIFPATSTYFAMMFYLYLLWSVALRGATLNFLLLTFAVVLILTSANVAFIFYACLALAVITVYRFLSVDKGGKQLFVLTALAWASAVLISSVRIFSCLAGVMGSNRMAETFHTLHDRSYMVLRLLVPEIAGWMGPDALNVLKSSNLNLIYSQLELPSSNPQNSFFVYFGVLPALFLMASFLVPMKGRPAFWKVYSLVVLGIALLWQPIWGILSILCLPLNHYSYHMIIVPVGICALIGYAGISWEARQWETPDFRRRLGVFGGLAGAYLCVFLTYLFPSLAFLTRIIFLAVGLVVVFYYALKKRSVLSSEKFLSWIMDAVCVLLLVFLVIVTLYLTIADIPKKEGLGTALILPFLWLTAAVGMILKFHNRYHGSFDFRGGLGFAGIVFVAPLLLSAAVVNFSTIEMILGLDLPMRVYAVDVLTGILRLLLLVQIGLLGFSAVRKKVLSLSLIFVLFLSFTALDLIVFNARFNNITSPFYFKNAFYPKPFHYRDIPESLRQQMDLVNYRVSHQDRQDFNANKNLVFNMPSYTGTVGYMTKRFSKLLTSFGYVPGIYMLYPEDATDNARFLDISAVKYVFNEDRTLAQRPSALGRLNFFFMAQKISDDDELLARLKDRDFDARKILLLSDSAPVTGGMLKDSVVIPIDKTSPNVVESRVSSSSSGYVLFADSYDEGWKAYLNGSLTPVLRANFNFMACVIPQAGDYKIRFVYEPQDYRRNLYLTIAGLLIFGCVIVIAGIKKIFSLWS